MTIKSECKFIAVKKFSITDTSGNIHIIPEGAVIMAEPIEGEKELVEITIMVSNIICDIFKAELNDFFRSVSKAIMENRNQKVLQ